MTARKRVLGDRQGQWKAAFAAIVQQSLRWMRTGCAYCIGKPPHPDACIRTRAIAWSDRSFDAAPRA
ncbi:hypothetical protein NY99_17075 [Xanthomonas phaseoli pv. phaseoli]|uniref:Uncharacterized protein n=1 Tax=Xanthomonas campestris pv. glycines TaxID=473421 RepID=A0AAX0I3C3_XANCG|nr:MULTISPECIES: hypothetical protein [Xanthomonas]AOY60856.1 hypothetical protein BHE84_00840 [Xanthomonas citri pv. glycines str. 8ra]ARV21227.1 hypothetical protein A9D66_01040 [Xanthomonas citri pv. glycines str. 12-2]EWC49987.1 hypothetical protein XAR_3489 [Xanthomonas citri pv. glycines str. 8ra]KGU53158.1 hypothetical protein NY99_17075 [Xanthomonas phaseoli pv. phaseoli]KHF49195.1 hypothetical protein QQ30_06835 [Xanthomonas phaseoli pv. phaseoli]